jgi:uncharacterized protein (DUF427 family)
MVERAQKIPGSDHPITVEPYPKHVVVSYKGEVIADTRAALRLQEASYPAVLYIPRGDADMGKLTRSDRTTHCPYKGEASYYSLPAGDAKAANAVWTYETPHDTVAEIREHLAFYPDRVEITETA